MADQLSLFLDEIQDEIHADELLFAPNGHRRCEHCRKRLVPWAGRLYCANPHCTEVSR
jgi:hypothetical protein